MYTSNFKFLIIILVSSLFLISNIADAQSLFFSGPKTTYAVGDNFSVSVLLDTGGRQINTIEGIVDIPLDKLDLIGVRHGSSIISLWVERPVVDRTKGLVRFSGGIPGGFTGSQGQILILDFKAKRIGSGRIFWQGIKVLLNDGLGTELKNVALGERTIYIQEAPSKPPLEEKKEPEEIKEVALPPLDVVSPENFIPLVSRHSSVAGNKYFVSFFAVDKDTGISHYEIQEKPFLVTWITEKFDEGSVRVESPYVLKRQYWPHTIIVRAYDQAGNYIDAEADKPMHPVLIWMIAFGIAVIATPLFYFSFSLKRKRSKMKA